MWLISEYKLVLYNIDNDDDVRSGSQVIQPVESETNLPQLDTENGTIQPDALNEVIINEQEQISGLTTEPLTMDNSISSGNCFIIVFVNATFILEYVSNIFEIIVFIVQLRSY